MILNSIISRRLLSKIPAFTKEVKHPVYGAPKTIKQTKQWKNKKTRPIEQLLEGFPFADEITKSRAISLIHTHKRNNTNRNLFRKQRKNRKRLPSKPNKNTSK